MKAGHRTARPALELFVWSRLALWGLAAGTVLLFEAHSNPLRGRWDRPRLHDLGPAVDVWARWDSDWYVQIAQHGYVWPSSRPAFFPLYPLLVAGLGRALGDHPVLAGVLVSLVACAGAFVLLERLARLKLGEEGARRAVLFLAVFPTTLFLGAVYSESLFLLLTLASFLLAERGRFLAAGAAGGLAALTRPVGLALVPALVLLAWRSGRRRRALAGAALVPLAFALYPLALWLWIGRPFAFLEAQSGIWRRHLSPYGPLGGFVEGVQQHAVKDLLVAVALVALALLAWRRLGAAYGAYALASLLLPLTWPSDTHALWSISRFGLVLFPVQLVLASLAGTRLRAAAVAVVLAGLAAYAVVKWALWYWVA
ncbi:MAG TPA: mannosyltransferase family protein [Gaiellaceae bacterium]|nr:mannosyltransferase family protein [Gaiellaceae bacterium]